MVWRREKQAHSFLTRASRCLSSFYTYWTDAAVVAAAVLIHWVFSVMLQPCWVQSALVGRDSARIWVRVGRQSTRWRSWPAPDGHTNVEYRRLAATICTAAAAAAANRCLTTSLHRRHGPNCHQERATACDSSVTIITIIIFIAMIAVHEITSVGVDCTASSVYFSPFCMLRMSLPHQF